MAAVEGTKLSIIILSINKRREFLDRILGVLRPQLTNDVELLVSATGEKEAVGPKRQRLKQAACGDYICFIDDDDMVSEDYVCRILKAVKENPAVDCVGFKGTLECPNGKVYRVSYSLRNMGKMGRRNDEFFCGVGHLTPIRRDIAQSVGFGDKNSGEDRDYCKLVMEKLRNEAFVDKVLYRYLARYNI